MSPDNLARMIRLAEEFFDMKNDPDQIAVDAGTMELLRRMHPATMSERSDENGPIAWILVIPTLTPLMEAFVVGAINELELLERTPVPGAYDALYLCSALVLPEYRGKGLAGELAASAVAEIRRDHAIRSLFYWGFSAEGDMLAASIAKRSGLPVYRKYAGIDNQHIRENNDG